MEAATPTSWRQRAWRVARPWIAFVPLSAGPIVFFVLTFFLLPEGGTYVQLQIEIVIWGVCWLVGLPVVLYDFRRNRKAAAGGTSALGRPRGSRLARISTIALVIDYFLVALLAAVPPCQSPLNCTVPEDFAAWLYGLAGTFPTLILSVLGLPSMGLLLLVVAVDARLGANRAKTRISSPIRDPSAPVRPT